MEDDKKISHPKFSDLNIEKRTRKVRDQFCEICPTKKFNQSLPQYAINTVFSSITFCESHFKFLFLLVEQLIAETKGS